MALAESQDHVALEVLPFATWMVPGAWITDFYFFPEIQNPRLGKGEKEWLCAFVDILKNFSLYNF